MAIEVPDWYRTVALVGVDITGTPVVVLLDSTGAIMAVMKGEYAGTLKNIAVDASGRVIMIPTDPADVWGNAISMGNAELAARLTGLGTFDRRGNVLLVDTFESGLGAWDQYGSVAASVATISSSQVRHGGLSLKLESGPSLNDEVYIWRYIGYPVLSNFGLEVSFTTPSTNHYLQLLLRLYDGTNRYDFSVRYNRDTTYWQYYSSTPAWINLSPALPLLEADFGWHTAKMIADGVNKKYVRLLVNSTEFDLSAYAPYSLEDATKPSLLTEILLATAEASNSISFLDNVLITTNEPA